MTEGANALAARGMTPDFTNKVVLVTGGSSGIGRETALAFARQGARVVIGDLNDDAAETVELIKEEGGEGLFVWADVSQAEQVEALVERTVETYGGLHCAFNNAGILPPTLPLAEQEEKTFATGQVFLVDGGQTVH